MWTNVCASCQPKPAHSIEKKSASCFSSSHAWNSCTFFVAKESLPWATTSIGRKGASRDSSTDATQCEWYLTGSSGASISLQMKRFRRKRTHLGISDNPYQIFACSLANTLSTHGKRRIESAHLARRGRTTHQLLPLPRASYMCAERRDTKEVGLTSMVS